MVLSVGLLFGAWFAIAIGAGANAGTLERRAIMPQVARDIAPPTSTPSPTRTPSATPTPPPTAVATQTPAPSGVFPHGVTWYRSSYSTTIYVVGVVTNATGRDAGFVEITGSFYSASGQLLATDFTYSDVSSIPAGGSSPFKIFLLTRRMVCPASV